MANVIDLIIAGHRTMDDLLARLRSSRGDRSRLAAELERLLLAPGVLRDFATPRSDAWSVLRCAKGHRHHGPRKFLVAHAIRVIAQSLAEFRVRDSSNHRARLPDDASTPLRRRHTSSLSEGVERRAVYSGRHGSARVPESAKFDARLSEFVDADTYHVEEGENTILSGLREQVAGKRRPEMSSRRAFRYRSSLVCPVLVARPVCLRPSLAPSRARSSPRRFVNSLLSWSSRLPLED